MKLEHVENNFEATKMPVLNELKKKLTVFRIKIYQEKKTHTHSNMAMSI